MKKNVLALLTTLCFHFTFAQLPGKVQINNKLSIAINKNVELLGFAYFIGFEGINSETKKIEIDGKEILEKDWQQYGYYFYQKYKSYATSKNLAQSLFVAEHLWLDYMIGLLMQVDDFPNAWLRPEIPLENYIQFSQKKDPAEAKKNVEIFLDGCNAFYKEVNFDQYLKESAKFYDAAIKQVKEALPEDDFIHFTENFYRKQFDNYTLIPSLTIPKGMGFASSKTTDGSTTVFNVFGGQDFQHFQNTDKLNMGFGNKQKLRELSVHEFGHSFVNPEIYKLPAETIEATATLFNPLRAAMEEQGYNTWKVCLIEHFVRAGEIAIAQNMGSAEATERLKQEYITNRKFIYIPIIVEELNLYYKNKENKYFEVVKRSMQRIAEALGQNSASQNNNVFTNEPNKASFHTEDIINFWKLFDQSYPNISAKLMQEEYIDKGSIGLKGFLKNRIENGKKLSKTIKEEMEYYQFIRPYTLTIDTRKKEFYECFDNLKKIYPAAVFPDVYFVIGRNNTGGTSFEKGLIIGAERFGEPKEKFKPALHIEFMNEVVAHELIHFQQKYPADNSLLAQCIKEGSADFLCELIAGDHSSNKEMFSYGEEHKEALWKEFMAGKDFNNWKSWLYYQKDKSRPKDLGYWMGYKICKAYYNKMEDKIKAVADILNITDFKLFFEKSGYKGE